MIDMFYDMWELSVAICVDILKHLNVLENEVLGCTYTCKVFVSILTSSSNSSSQVPWVFTKSKYCTWPQSW